MKNAAYDGQESAENYLYRDLLRTAESLDVAPFEGTTVLISGVTGLIGRQVALTLLCAARIRKVRISVIGLARSREKAQALFREVLDRPDFRLDYSPLSGVPEIRGPVDWIVHTASATTSGEFVAHPVETIEGTVIGTRNLLHLAEKKKSSGFVYLSSLEMYGMPENAFGMVRENEYGYLDPLNIRSCYPEGKRMAECLCSSCAAEYGVPARIARLGQVFGAGVPDTENRVFAQFARSVLRGEDIVLHTDGSTYHNYCYTADAVRAILLLLSRGTPGEAYNVANRNAACSIREMAELLCRLYPPSRVRFEIDGKNRGYPPSVRVELDPSKIEALGWRPEVPLEEMFRRMVESMRRPNAMPARPVFLREEAL